MLNGFKIVLEVWKEKRNWEDIFFLFLSSLLWVLRLLGFGWKSIEWVCVFYDKFMLFEWKKRSFLEMKKEVDGK